MLELLLASWLFYPFSLALFLILVFLSEADYGIFTTLLIVLTLGILQFFTSYAPFTYLMNEPVKSAIYIALYLVIGFIYIYIKWYFISFKAGKLIRENNKYFSYGGDTKYLPLKVSNWKSNLYFWFILWPFSAVYTLLNDPVRIIFEKVYLFCSTKLQNIADSQIPTDKNNS